MTKPSKWIEVCRTGPLTPAEVARKMGSGHSVYSPSGSEMSMTCEESLYLNAVAEDSSGYEAAEGTVAHSLSEQWIKDGAAPSHMIGQTVVQNGFDIEIDEEMMSFVADFVQLCDRESDGAHMCESEKRVDVSHLTPIPDQGGTMDFVAIFPQYLTVVDLKYGKEPVDACYFDDEGARQINKQLAVYASGVFREWDWLYDFQHIKIVISQPRIIPPVSEVVITRAELEEFEVFAKERWARTWRFRDEMTRTPSVKGCRWCAVRNNCSALYLFLEQSADVFSSFDESGALIEGNYEEMQFDNQQLSLANEKILDPLSAGPFPKTPDPRELTTAAMAKLLRYRKLMENFFNSVERELLTRAISGEEDIPWWKLVEGRSRRKMVDDVDHIIETVEGWGLTRKDIYVTTMLSPAQMERELHTRLNEGKKKGDKSRVSLDKVKTMLEESGLTVKPPGQKTLAPRSDNRRALPKDGDVFDSWSED